MKSSHFAIGAIGLALIGLWYAAGGSRPEGVRAAERLSVASPIAHDNLAVYFIHGPDEIDDAKVITLQQALELHCAVVHETGNVNTLVIENLSPDHELFVQSGDIIKGGRQDRLIAIDMLLPPGSGKMSFPAHCVEQGRWSGRPGEQDAQFAKSESFAVGNGIKLANVNRNQGQVWANVQSSQANLTQNLGTAVAAPESPTSLQLSLENKTLQEKVAAYESALRSAGEERQGVVGVVFVVNGKLTGGEQYGSNGMFKKAWPKLLRSAAVESLAYRPSAVASVAPTAREIERFLASSSQQEIRGESRPAVANPNQTQMVTTSRPDLRSFALYNVAGMGPPDIVGTANPANTTPSRPVGIPGTYVAGGQVSLIPDTGFHFTTTLESPTIPIPSGPTGTDGFYFAGEFLTLTETRVSRRQGSLSAASSTTLAPPNSNRVIESRVDNNATLMLESRDPSRNNAVIHRSYIKK